MFTCENACFHFCNPKKENLHNLLDGETYSRTSSGVTDDFIIQIDFNKPHSVPAVSFKKAPGIINGQYAPLYKNTCLIATYANGSMGTPNCTDESYGFSFFKQQLNWAINGSQWEEYITFGTSWPFDNNLSSNIVKIQLVFDTSASGSDTFGANAAEYAVHDAIKISGFFFVGYEEN